jgi:hypothetical protein
LKFIVFELVVHSIVHSHSGNNTNEQFSQQYKRLTNPCSNSKQETVPSNQKEGIFSRNTEVMTGNCALNISILIDEFNELLEAPQTKRAAINNYLHRLT